MPITGHRASDRCMQCTKDRTECGNCRYLKFDRRQSDRRRGCEENNFSRGEEVAFDRGNVTSRESSGTVESAHVVF